MFCIMSVKGNDGKLYNYSVVYSNVTVYDVAELFNMTRRDMQANTGLKQKEYLLIYFNFWNNQINLA